MRAYPIRSRTERFPKGFGESVDKPRQDIEIFQHRGRRCGILAAHAGTRRFKTRPHRTEGGRLRFREFMECPDFSGFKIRNRISTRLDVRAHPGCERIGGLPARFGQIRQGRRHFASGLANVPERVKPGAQALQAQGLGAAERRFGSQP